MDKNTQSFLTNLGTGVAILVTVFLIFDILRYYFPTIYYFREKASEDPEWNSYDGRPLHAPARPSHRPLHWILPVLRYKEEDLVATHGLDAALYVRFLREQMILFGVLALFTAIVLYPTYATGGNKLRPNKHPLYVTGIETLSLANVQDKNPRLWATLVAEVVVLTLIAFQVFKQLSAYVYYRRQYRSDSKSNPSNYAVLVMNIPSESQSEASIREFFTRCFPDEIVAVHQVRDAQELVDAKNRVLNAAGKREAAMHYSDKNSKRDDAVRKWLTEQVLLEKELEIMLNNLDEYAPITHAAFVIFRSKRAATMAACTPLWHRNTDWNISRAPEPRAVNWDRIDITNWTSEVRRFTTLVALTAFAIFWFAPVAAIQSLANLKEIAELQAFHFLRPLVTSKDTAAVNFVAFVEQILPPLLLFVVLQLVPLLFRFVLSFERISSKALLDTKIRNFLFLFYIMSNFVYVVLTGSFLKRIKEIFENPSTIVSLLSTTVPAQATFLMKYVLINSFLGSTLGLLNIGRLIGRPFLYMKARTIRQKRKADSVSTQFRLFKMYAIAQMISLISIVYSTIAPVICLVATVYFGLAYLCSKHILLFAHRPMFEGGGHMFRGSCYSLLIGVYLHELSMIGIFSLKRAAPQAIIQSVVFLMTLFFCWFCFRKFSVTGKHGALNDQIIADEEAGCEDKVPPNFAELYIHPGLVPLEPIEDLSGVSPEDYVPPSVKDIPELHADDEEKSFRPRRTFGTAIAQFSRALR